MQVIRPVVTVTPKQIQLLVGTWYYGAHAEVDHPDACCQCVHWYSSNTSVATVNPSSGYIYANAVGTAQIIAVSTCDDTCFDSLTVIVTDTICVESVSLDHSDLALAPRECITLSPTVCPSNATNKTLNWQSSNPSVVTVNSSGKVCGVSLGTATVTATAADGSGKTASCFFRVTNDTLVSSVTVSPAEKTMRVYESAYFHATVLPENAANRTIVWRSSNPRIVTVNPHSGLVIARSTGSACICASATDGSGAVGVCNFTVIPQICIEDIELDYSSISIYKGSVCTLNATVCPANATNKKLLWQSSDPYVASVNARTGEILARNPGTATVCADAQDGSGVRDCCRVTVLQTSVAPTEEKPVPRVNEQKVADPVDAYTGAHLLSNTLMSLFGGQGLKLVASYDSTKLSCGMLGIGWYHNYEKSVEVDGCEAFVYNTPSSFSYYVADSDCCTRFTCCSPNKNGYVLTVDHSRPYPYMIDCNSAMTEYYDDDGNLAKIVDHQGFETLITYSDTLVTITDSVSGKKIYLEKDSSCKVVRVYDDAERETNLTYTSGLLTEISDPNGNTLTFTYDRVGRVLTGTDSEGICYFENTYDKYGRVVRQKDAVTGSLPTLFAYCCDVRVTTNRTGKQSRREYDCNGLLVKYTDENGNVKRYEYDDRYNVTKETDAKGNSVIKSYNCFNKLSQITDRNGNVTQFLYDTAGNLTTVRYPAIGNVVPEETFVYNARNQITQHTDLRGTATLYTYDANGMPASKKVGSKNAELFSYLNGLLTSQTDAKGNTTVYSYNTVGQMTSKTDADNKVTGYIYDAVGNLLRIVDPNNNTTVFAYDGNYQKTAVTDPNGNRTQYSYNGNMKNTAIVLPDGNTIRYEYDGEDRPVRITDQANNVTLITYDNGGRVISKRFADGGLVQYGYDAVGNVISETNQKGAVTLKTYDNNGNVLTVTDDEGNTTSYEYNAMSKVTRITNAVAGATVNVYSPAGDLLSETDALGNSKTYTYDAFGNRLSATDARNNTTTYTYDANNNLLSVTDPLNHVTTYTYDCLNRCISVTDALNHTVSYTYDALGRKTAITDARGNVFSTTYDGNGNVLTTVDAKNNTVSTTVYNSLNLPLSVTDAVGKVTSYTYNALGKTASVTDPQNHRTEFSYNAVGLNTSVLDAANHTSSASYDLLGNATRIAGPLGGATNYAYDDMGRLVSESTVSGGTKSYEYNELSIRKKLTNARGQIRQYFYDSLGRITGVAAPEGTVSYTYDANGNVLTVTDSQGTVTRTYDALNRVATCTDTYGNTIGYLYDAAGNLSRITYPDNTAVNYAYDANNNLISVTDWANRVTSYTYDVNNRVTGVVKPDGSVTTTVYDNKQRVTSTVERTSGNVVISGFEYTYDDLSRIAEEKILAGAVKVCYTYDALSRVTDRTVRRLSDNSVVSSESFTYDAAGNVTGASGSTFAYDTNNRLTAFNGNSVSYDLDGNMLSDGAGSYTYDSANRLLSAYGHTYTYNAEDVRIRDLGPGEDTSFTYDTNGKLSRLLCKTTGSTVTKYVYGRGLIGEETGSAFKTYHFDFRGSTVAVTNASGTVTDTFAYDTYGKLLSRTGTSAILFGFNGRDGVITDTNGLIYMRARYYSPDMKRFINADVVPGEISNAITLNRFAYANGNPVSLVDPFGLSAERGTSYNPTSSQYDFFFDCASAFMEGVDWIRGKIYNYKYNNIFSAKKPKRIPQGSWILKNSRKLAHLDDAIGSTSKVAKGISRISKAVDIAGDIASVFVVLWETGTGIAENIENGTRTQKIVSDAIVDTGIGVGLIAGSTAVGAWVGSLIPIPVVGTLVGAGAGYLVGEGADWLLNADLEILGNKSVVNWAKDGAAAAADWIVEDLPDIAADAWDATICFIEDTGETIGGFFEDAVNAIGGLFSGILG